MVEVERATGGTSNRRRCSNWRAAALLPRPGCGTHGVGGLPAPSSLLLQQPRACCTAPCLQHLVGVASSRQLCVSCCAPSAANPAATPPAARSTLLWGTTKRWGASKVSGGAGGGARRGASPGRREPCVAREAPSGWRVRSRAGKVGARCQGNARCQCGSSAHHPSLSLPPRTNSPPKHPPPHSPTHRPLPPLHCTRRRLHRCAAAQQGCRAGGCAG